MENIVYKHSTANIVHKYSTQIYKNRKSHCMLKKTTTVRFFGLLYYFKMIYLELDGIRKKLYQFYFMKSL